MLYDCCTAARREIVIKKAIVMGDMNIPSIPPNNTFNNVADSLPPAYFVVMIYLIKETIYVFNR
jgi:hypothetical protein